MWTLLDDLESLDGRGGGIRTPDPLLPKQMRYQTALRPDGAIVSRMQDFEANAARSLGPESGEDVNQPLVQPDEEGQRQSKHQQKDNSHNKQKVPTVTYGTPSEPHVLCAGDLMGERQSQSHRVGDKFAHSLDRQSRSVTIAGRDRCARSA